MVFFLAVLFIAVSPGKSDAKLSDAEIERVSKLDGHVRSLYSIEGVFVTVEHLNEYLKAIGLTEDQLKTDVELKLRLAGVKVSTIKEWLTSKDNARLYVNIATIGNEYTTSWGVRLHLYQTVSLERPPHEKISASTWISASIGRCGKSELKESAIDSLKTLTDRFLNDYFTANPKQVSSLPEGRSE